MVKAVESLTIEQRAVYNQEKKSMVVAYVLLLFLGGLGLHRFYLNQIASGAILCALSLISMAFPLVLLVTACWLLVDLFLTYDIVNQHNGGVVESIKKTEQKGE